MLTVNVRVMLADRRANREAAAEMAGETPGWAKRMTVREDKRQDIREFVCEMEQLNVTLHWAHSGSGQPSVADGRATRHEGYWVSQRRRKLVDKFFGWAKVVG